VLLFVIGVRPATVAGDETRTRGFGHRERA
jgi:hypothetical protein